MTQLTIQTKGYFYVFQKGVLVKKIKDVTYKIEETNALEF